MIVFPLSKAEYGIFAEQVSNANTAYNLPFKIALDKNVDIERLSAAISAVINAHPCLKTVFSLDENGEAYKNICDRDIDVKIIEAEDFDFRSLIRPFDLHKDIMCRFYIIKSSEGNTLFFDIHHIIFDGASLGILLAQINRAYSGEAIEPEAFSANDFALEERELLISNEYEKAKEYYQKAFDGIDTDSSLYTDKNDREPAAKELVYPFERVNYSLLKEFADRRGVRLSTVLNGVFSYLLSRYSGGDQSLFASFYHGRDSRLDSTLGMFIKTYPVYADFSGDDSISDFLNKLDAQVALNRENSLYSYVDFCEDTRLNPSVLFAYQGEIPA